MTMLGAGTDILYHPRTAPSKITGIHTVYDLIRSYCCTVLHIRTVLLACALQLYQTNNFYDLSWEKLSVWKNPDNFFLWQAFWCQAFDGKLFDDRANWVGRHSKFDHHFCFRRTFFNPFIYLSLYICKMALMTRRRGMIRSGYDCRPLLPVSCQVASWTSHHTRSRIPQIAPVVVVRFFSCCYCQL